MQHADDGAAGGSLENGPGQARSSHGTVGVDDHDVHAAELLEVLLGDVVEEADLVAALGIGLLLWEQGGGVVASRLRRTRSSAPGAVVLGRHPDGDGFEPMGEVGARGGGDDVVVNHLGGAYAEERLGGEGERPQVEGLALARGHPGGVGPHQVHQ